MKTDCPNETRIYVQGQQVSKISQRWHSTDDVDVIRSLSLTGSCYVKLGGDDGKKKNMGMVLCAVWFLI